MKTYYRLAIFLFALLGLAACVSVPERVEPSAVQYEGQFTSNGPSGEFNDAWWAQFDDLKLTSLIDRALEANKSLEVAAANIRLVEAIAGRQDLERSYATGATASGQVGRSARNGQDIGVSVSGRLGATWEIDVFDRIAAQIEAAEFDVEVAREARRDVEVIVASQTALNYIQLRGAQRRLEVARQNAQTQAEGLDLLRTLFDNGRATRLDIDRAEALYRTTLASQPRFEATALASLSGLAALTGQTATAPDESLLDLINVADDIPEHRGILATGSVEALIRRRPDIREAEAAIGRDLALSEAVRADLFPRLTMNLDLLSLFDDNTNDIGDLSSFGFGIGPSIQWAGPDLRRVRANIDISDARALLAISRYEAVIIDALSEVEIALTNYTKELERRDDLRQAVASAQRALELASLRFEEGLDDYLDVLEAQRTVLDAQDRLAESRLQSSVQAIAAYRALGGVGLSSTP
jgi:multidrug efflux system outer membrane protein